MNMETKWLHYKSSSKDRKAMEIIMFVCRYLQRLTGSCIVFRLKKQIYVHMNFSKGVKLQNVSLHVNQTSIVIVTPKYLCSVML